MIEANDNFNYCRINKEKIKAGSFNFGRKFDNRTNRGNFSEIVFHL